MSKVDHCSINFFHARGVILRTAAMHILTCVSNKKAQLAFYNKKNFFFLCKRRNFYVKPCIFTSVTNKKKSI
jgi:hypothetical protein